MNVEIERNLQIQKGTNVDTEDFLSSNYATVKRSSDEIVGDEIEINEVATNDEYKIRRSYFYKSWFLLCYGTGPASSLTRMYIPAVIQSIASVLGKDRNENSCNKLGNDCFIKLGHKKVHHSSYVLYLRATYTCIEGILSFVIMGIADFSTYRKNLLIFAALLYGILAIPFYFLKQNRYAELAALSTLYCLLNICNCVYQILENSYIPLFMRSRPSERSVEKKENKEMLKEGSQFSVLGMFAANCGGITALALGVIISHKFQRSLNESHVNFLLSITISGCITLIFVIAAIKFIPKIEGRPRPRNENIVKLSFKRFLRLLKNIRRYPDAFIYCISWVLWNISYSNFSSVFNLLFRSTLGIGGTDAEYTVFSFMSYVVASLGSIAWMLLYRRFQLDMKKWGYILLSISLLTNLWRCLGIQRSLNIGFKNRWEFWFFEILYNASGSALRCLNRVLYSSMIPRGEEAQYLGLEVMLGVATGWIGSLVNAVIQDKTDNDRFPFLPNFFIVMISIVAYYNSNVERGMSLVNISDFPI